MGTEQLLWQHGYSLCGLEQFAQLPAPLPAFRAYRTARCYPDRVMPTTVVSAGQACFGNFICASTATGEPLGFKPQEYRAAAHIRAILAASGFNVAASVELVGFSKGAVVLNQVRGLREASCLGELRCHYATVSAS